MTPRPGSVRYTDDHGRVHEVAPRHPSFSTALFVATEYWDGNRWVPIHEGNKNLSEIGRLQKSM